MTKEKLKQVQQTKQQELQALSQHMHINAFANVWLGSNAYGLLEACPHDMMHAFLHGVLMYVLEVIMSPLNPSEICRLDEFVDKNYCSNQILFQCTASQMQLHLRNN